jgi:predicted nucleotidyltransferase
MSEHVVDVASAIRAGRYKDAVVAFAAGSIVRGEGTSFSDLDLVVVYARLPCAYRESFNFSGYPVEAFVHDPETLEYFFLEIDKPSGIPALAQMVVEGVEIPGPSEISRELKRRAEAIISAGPPAIDRDGEQRMRYAVSDGLDDLRAPRSRDEMIAAAGRLYEQLADYHLRRQGLWSARGKAIPRILRRTDPKLCAAYCDAFQDLFVRGEPEAVIRLAEDLLAESGGPLFDGYRADAPPAWRRPRTAV